jgi:hypothetical protein
MSNISNMPHAYIYHEPHYRNVINILGRKNHLKVHQNEPKSSDTDRPDNSEKLKQTGSYYSMFHLKCNPSY